MKVKVCLGVEEGGSVGEVLDLEDYFDNLAGDELDEELHQETIDWAREYYDIGYKYIEE